MALVVIVGFILLKGDSDAMTQDTALSLDAMFPSSTDANASDLADQYTGRLQSDIQVLLIHLDREKAGLVRDPVVAAAGKTESAIRLLGELRSPLASKPLAEIIASRDSTFSIVSNEEPHFFSFPAAVALSKIGMPAVDPLIHNLRTAATDSTVFHLSAITLEAILTSNMARPVIAVHAVSYPDLAEGGRLQESERLISIGHRAWSADSASDFELP